MVFADYARNQYALIRGSRNVLLDHLEKLTPGERIGTHAGFGRGGSVRNLIVHNANTYQYWIGEVALGRKMDYARYDDYTDVASVRQLFATIDELVADFLAVDEHTVFSYDLNGIAGTVTPMDILTHVVTHEFHHKGQIMTMGRMLGHIPIDTDIIR